MEPDLDPLIHQPTRFRILLLLFRFRQASAAWVKSTLGLTDGNLWGHARRLVEAGYLHQGRILTSEGFQVVLRISPEGSQAFQRYLASWRAFVAENEHRGPSPRKSAEPRP